MQIDCVNTEKQDRIDENARAAITGILANSYVSEHWTALVADAYKIAVRMEEIRQEMLGVGDGSR